MLTLHAIVNVSELDSLDFSKLKQNSKDTCRKSLDGAKAVISFGGVKTVKELFSGEMLINQTFTTKELYGPTGDQSMLSGIFESIPFSRTLAEMAYSGHPKTTIKEVVKGALESGIITQDQVPEIKKSLIRYAPKNNDKKTNLEKDFFDDVTGVNISSNIVFDENTQSIKKQYKNTIRSGHFEEEETYITKSDQYFNLKSIVKHTTKKEFAPNIDQEGNILEEKYVNDVLTTGIKYSKDGCLGPISNNIKVYTNDEIKEVLRGPDWTSIVPQVESLSAASGSYGDTISLYGSDFYNITGVRLGDYSFLADNISSSQISFVLPSVCSDGNVELIGHETFRTNFFFDYINERPFLNTVELSNDLLTLGGTRLDNVKFVVFSPEGEGEEAQKIGYPFFSSQNPNQITLSAPDYTGAYEVNLIDIENRTIN